MFSARMSGSWYTFVALRLSLRWTSITFLATRLSARASPAAEMTPPTTTTVLPRERIPSLAAQ